MSAKTVKNEFIRFILDAEKKESLLEEFLGIRRAEILEQFFKDKGYQIFIDDCEGIIQVENMKKEAVFMTFKMMKKAADCPDKGY